MSSPVLSASAESTLYLEFYYHCARQTLSSQLDTEFWSRITLQMAQTEDSVRHAVIALGYLHKIESGSLKHARLALMGGHPRETLFFHYNKAIGCLVNRMAEASYTMEIGLVTCLLFVCIEYLQGSYRDAFAHLSSGLRMISERQDVLSVSGLTSASPPRLHRELVRPFSKSLSPENSQRPNGSSKITMIEKDLVPMYNRAVSGAILYGLNVDQIYDIPLPRPQVYQEHPFKTIWEAQAANLELRNASLRFATSKGPNLFLQAPITIYDLETQEQLIECHLVWRAALRKFEDSVSLSDEDGLISSAIKIGNYITHITVSCALDVCQMQYDGHLSSFQKIIYHARKLIDSMKVPTPSPSSSPSSIGGAISDSSSKPASQPVAHFTFDALLIPSLYFTVMRCRCPVIRREAVNLLERNLPREAIWDADQHALVSKRVIEIEETEVDSKTGWPIERTRLWAAIFSGDVDRHGKFWATFSSADWVRKGAPGRGTCGVGTGRLDAQWEELFTL
jgi:hypothetical protein